MGEKGVKNYDSEDDASDSEDDDEIFESDAESDHDVFSSKRRKKTEPKDHLDHESYSWCLMNYTIGKLVLHNLQAFLPDVGFELTGLFSRPNIRTSTLQSPLIVCPDLGFSSHCMEKSSVAQPTVEGRQFCVARNCIDIT